MTTHAPEMKYEACASQTMAQDSILPINVHEKKNEEEKDDVPGRDGRGVLGGCVDEAGRGRARTAFMASIVWNDLPSRVLLCITGFLDAGEVLCFSLTCSSNRAAVQASYGGSVPPMKTKYLKLAVSSGLVEMVKWMRKKKPPCPCDFKECLRLAESEAVRMYFRKGLDLLHMCQADLMTPAVTTDIVALINNQGADVHVKTSGGEYTPLHMVCMQEGPAKNVMPLLDLHYSKYVSGFTAVAMALLEKGAEVNTMNSGGSTPLHYAAENGHVELAITLIQKGADVDAKNMHGSTPLHTACADGRTEVAMVLLEEGANVNADTSSGRRPLHSACEGGHAEVAMVLLENGADVNAHTNTGYTPLRSHKFYNFPLNTDLVKLLVSYGAEE
jgi:hypothetical protein